MFEYTDGEWRMKDTKEKATIVHQDYFLSDVDNKFSSSGTNWKEFEKVILNLLAGN